MKTILNIAAVCLFGTTALATGSEETGSQNTLYPGNGTMTYELFETAVAHADLEVCPDGFNPEETFCRLTLASGMVHIFVFTHEGEQPLIAVKSYNLEETDFLSF